MKPSRVAPPYPTMVAQASPLPRLPIAYELSQRLSGAVLQPDFASRDNSKPQIIFSLLYILRHDTSSLYKSCCNSKIRSPRRLQQLATCLISPSTQLVVVAERYFILPRDWEIWSAFQAGQKHAILADSEKWLLVVLPRS